MIRFCLTALCLFIFCSAFAQKLKYRNIYSSPQVFKLSTRMASETVGGNTRTIYRFNLPPGCIGFIYTVSSASSGNTPQFIDLAGQIASILPNVNPAAGSAIKLIANEIVASQSTSSVDVYCLDPNTANAFTNRQDKYWRYSIELSRKGFIGGAVPVEIQKSFLSTPICLGFINPSSLSSVNVSLEVIAIIEEW